MTKVEEDYALDHKVEQYIGYVVFILSYSMGIDT